MANQGANKTKTTGTVSEKGSDTINFTYSAAVEAALEKLDSPRDEVIPTTTRSSKRNANKRVTPVKLENEKPKNEVVINKLDEIYSDWVFLRGLNSPRDPDEISLSKTVNTSVSEQEVPSDKNKEPPEKVQSATSSERDEEKSKKPDVSDKGDQKQRKEIGLLTDRTDAKQKKRDTKPMEKLKKERDKE